MKVLLHSLVSVFVLLLLTLNFSHAVSIEEYINNTKKMLSKVHAKNPKRVYYNEPVFIKAPATCSNLPAKTMVFIHGLKSSPYLSRNIAKKLSQKCFNVFLPLLDGHGTTPDALLTVKLQQWEKSVAHFIEMASKQFKGKIYLGGVSLGGALSVNHLLKNPSNRISGLFLADAALKISFFATFAKFIKPFMPFWEKYPENNLAQYNSLTTNAIEQIHKLTKQIYNSKNKIYNIPILAFYSVPDHTINSEDALLLLHKLANQAKLNINVMLQPSYKGKATKAFRGIATTIINSSDKKYRLIGSAHQSVIMDINDPYYGFDGEYADCIHYYKTDLYKPCITDNQKTIYGEKTKKNLKQGLLRRTSFNPELQQVVDKVSKYMQ